MRVFPLFLVLVLFPTVAADHDTALNFDGSPAECWVNNCVAHFESTTVAVVFSYWVDGSPYHPCPIADKCQSYEMSLSDSGSPLSLGVHNLTWFDDHDNHNYTELFIIQNTSYFNSTIQSDNIKDNILGGNFRMILLMALILAFLVLAEWKEDSIYEIIAGLLSFALFLWVWNTPIWAYADANTITRLCILGLSAYTLFAGYSGMRNAWKDEGEE